MKTNDKYTLPSFFRETLREYGDRPAMSMVGDQPITYKELDKRILSVMAMLERSGIGKGDKVALLSTNIVNWGVSYYAITFMGAVVVPILPDFHTDEIKNILTHSDSRAIFISNGLLPKISEKEDFPDLLRIRIEDFTLLESDQNAVKYDPDALPVKRYSVFPEDVAAIIYTSGTTGKSKGVMLTHLNICFSATMSGRVQEIVPTDRFLSVLPLSHTYENTIGFILPMLSGACIYYTGKVPTPSVLLPAMETVKPTLMLTVPLIIEKIFYNRIKPQLNKNFLIKAAMSVPFIKQQILSAAGKKLKKTFGGELKFFGIGGAKLNREVEQFLMRAKFPYAIGYGLTETSPLLAGCNPMFTKLQSTGKAIEEIELKINRPDPNTGEGEIWAKGPNVMLGYYKEPELTKEIITPDGWLKTGDLGLFDKDGYLYIRERMKNVIVRSGGENIYPEEIESVINTYHHVNESLVLDRNGKLTALVNFDIEKIKLHYKHHLHLFNHQNESEYINQEIKRLSLELQTFIKHRLNKFSQVQEVVYYPEAFEKTATLKIKRYLYS